VELPELGASRAKRSAAAAEDLHGNAGRGLAEGQEPAKTGAAVVVEHSPWDMIAGWLKAGVFEPGKGFAPTEEGTPQGGLC
jgi:hypothetical protein